MPDPLHRVELSAAGLPWIIDPYGRRIAPAIISGGAIDDSTSEDDDDDDEEEGSDGAKSYTKSQLDSIVGRAMKRAEKEAQRKLAETLGMDPVAAAKALKDQAEREAATMTEADRKLAEAETKRAEAERIAAEARLAKVTARAEARLIRAGLDDAAIDFVLPSLGLAEDADDEDIDAAIEAARAKVPRLFDTTTSDTGTDRKPPPSSNGNRDRRRNPPPQTSIDKGKERAERYLAERRYA